MWLARGLLWQGADGGELTVGDVVAIELFQRPGVIGRAGGFEAEQIVRGEVFEAIGAFKVVGMALACGRDVPRLVWRVGALEVPAGDPAASGWVPAGDPAARVAAGAEACSMISTSRRWLRRASSSSVLTLYGSPISASVRALPSSSCQGMRGSRLMPGV